MKAAWLWAQESYCKRNKVGAVLAKDGRILATGYNGSLSGLPNVCEDGDTTALHIVHAEQNVITFSSKQGIGTNGCDLYVTLSPCIMCAKLIVQAGISTVIYDKEYRDTSGIDLLKECNVEVIKL
jgi:dCMP deaminase